MVVIASASVYRSWWAVGQICHVGRVSGVKRRVYTGRQFDLRDGGLEQ